MSSTAGGEHETREEYFIVAPIYSNLKIGLFIVENTALTLH